MRLKCSFCSSENQIGSELLQVSEVSHKSWRSDYPVDYKAVTLYCCLVQGKKEDEVIDKLYREKRRTDVGKDEE